MPSISYSFSRKLIKTARTLFPELELSYVAYPSKVKQALLSQAKAQASQAQVNQAQKIQASQANQASQGSSEVQPQTTAKAIVLAGKTCAQFTPSVAEVRLDPVTLVGWGYRPTTTKARALAQEYQASYLALEDGFIRSYDLGVNGSTPLSIVYDHLGIYYDLTKPSRLEQLIFQEASEDECAQAQQVQDYILAHALSKYNHAPDLTLAQAQAWGYDSNKQISLVVDQTYQDMAVVYGQANEQTFAQMLQTALEQNPDGEVWLKVHPDVLTGKKQGYFKEVPARVRFISQDCNPQSLLKFVDKVYVVTSQLGFEALIAGKQVHTFGACWYAGWGLTQDYHPFIAELVNQGERRCAKSLNELVLAAYLRYPRYANPATGEEGNIWQVLTYLAQQRAYHAKLQGELYALDMSFWKRAVLKPFLPAGVKFTTREKLAKILSKQTAKLNQKENLKAQKLQQEQKELGEQKNNREQQSIELQNKEQQHKATLLLWGQGKAPQLELAQQYQLPVVRIEDGFIRSVGLGSNLVAPLSLVLDGKGIYFNSQTTSDLEDICQNYQFAPYELAQAQVLQAELISQKIAKYNVGEQSIDFKRGAGKRLILVPGQVEDDASLAYGSPEIRSNLTLLQKVRELNPEAYIIYKPHPDVVSKNRLGDHSLEKVQQYADEQIEQANILDCIAQVDEVHTMTSLAGFEALLRGKQVHCYGIPFYAGWGLTTDHLPCDRRSRRLTLEQLMAATLLVYPLYKLPNQREFTQALDAVTFLSLQRQRLKGVTPIKRNWLAKQFSKIYQLYRAWRY
ncbi:hypothetical protein CKF54_07560 [Psittacicella hinzii]|uniref:Capsular polysaccharide export protein n=1 Tax=Psittacicella hinzii TaxID=2028575 RepID=A0A3A1Y4P0_9GAMM|nr:capsular polysaccharide biosynthesis protein [Psittacicella hinzii]RIY31127.1 hypothetical protein CKF54_07560 [Psittacicella hinzii]